MASPEHKSLPWKTIIGAIAGVVVGVLCALLIVPAITTGHTFFEGIQASQAIDQFESARDERNMDAVKEYCQKKYGFEPEVVSVSHTRSHDEGNSKTVAKASVIEAKDPDGGVFTITVRYKTDGMFLVKLAF